MLQHPRVCATIALEGFSNRRAGSAHTYAEPLQEKASLSQAAQILMSPEERDHRQDPGPSCLSFPSSERKESDQMLRGFLALGGSG